MSRLLLAACATAAFAALAAGAAGAPQTADLGFYPQAGILWRDLYPNNFVDLDPGPGIRDYACGTQTYDGHTGIDTDVRSFREMDLGVPVFAALDGRVISVEDGNYDRNFGSRTPPFDNHVVLEHASGRFTIYGHLRRGIRLRRDGRVAGQQLGWTASSGNSSWPHLHFTSHVGGEVNEPFAGPCRPGASGWLQQVPLPSEPYVRDLALSAQPFTGRRALPHDLAPRRGTFVRGTRVMHLRVELGAVPPGAGVTLRIARPDGTTAVERTLGLSGAHHGRGHAVVAFRLALGATGSWRIHVLVDGKTLEEAPFSVVARARAVRNRPPNGISVAVQQVGEVTECRVSTSLATEDPDFELVRYRYRWSAGGRTLRAVTSAALSDVLAKRRAPAGERPTCSVTPSDGRRAGPTASASADAR